jgi:hypothetical protein
MRLHTWAAGYGAPGRVYKRTLLSLVLLWLSCPFEVSIFSSKNELCAGSICVLVCRVTTLIKLHTPLPQARGSGSLGFLRSASRPEGKHSTEQSLLLDSGGRKFIHTKGTCFQPCFRPSTSERMDTVGTRDVCMLRQAKLARASKGSRLRDILCCHKSDRNRHGDGTAHSNMPSTHPDHATQNFDNSNKAKTAMAKLEHTMNRRSLVAIAGASAVAAVNFLGAPSTSAKKTTTPPPEPSSQVRNCHIPSRIMQTIHTNSHADQS